MIYFNAETQARVLRRLHFALSEGGLLFLGWAEVLLSHTSLFVLSDLKWRFFRRMPRVAARERTLVVAPTPAESEGSDHDPYQVLRDQALLASPTALVIMSEDDHLVLSNARADTLFNLSSRDTGRRFQDF